MRIQAYLGASLLALASCASWMRAPAPMSSLEDLAPDGPAKCLLVLLPGAGDHAGAFARQGFIEAVRARALSVDIISADATMGYYLRGSFVRRLDEDVIGPQRVARGARETWLLGTSMGGLGSLLFAEAHPEEVQGVLAMSPFLGPQGVVSQVRAAGGLAQWQAPPEAPSTGRNYADQLWRWLQTVTVKGAPGPRLEVGWAEHEPLASADALLGEALPDEQVYRAEGRHDWVTWKAIFDQWLERSPFARDCAPARAGL